MQDKYLRRWSDENGGLFWVGRCGSRYFIESVAPAFTPNAGEKTRRYVSKADAMSFNPDPIGDELETVELQRR